MNAHYYDAALADGYYLQRQPGEQPLPGLPPARGDRVQASCPACYRPVLEAGYCVKCEESGAAQRHATHPHRTMVVAS